MGPVRTKGDIRKRGVGGGDWGQDSGHICLSLALLGRREKVDLRASNLVKLLEPPVNTGAWQRLHSRISQAPGDRGMNPSARPQGVPGLVTEQETNHYSGE